MKRLSISLSNLWVVRGNAVLDVSTTPIVIAAPMLLLAVMAVMELRLPTIFCTATLLAVLAMLMAADLAKLLA